MDEIEEERIMTARRMARKLARNKSKNRTVRKLPQSMIIVPRNGGKVFPVRRAINTNKRMTYILLLGAVMCAYWYDVDVDTLEEIVKVVERQAQQIPGVKLGSLGIPGLS
jgi:hypothetical protein